MLYFLKLGGSLITDKATPQTPRPEVLARLAAEIAEARRLRPELRLVLGHGSGSFGHAEARRHGTRNSVRSDDEWQGFALVSATAARLNRIVVDAMLAAGVPVISFQPSASAQCRDGMIQAMAVEAIASALEHGLAPLVYGDVAFDEIRGGTIISTEDIFRYLALRLRPARVLLAGLDAGVYADWPAGRTVAPRLTAGTSALNVAGSNAPDVTGGMASKVAEMSALVREAPGAQVLIFSGDEPGNVLTALTEAEPAFGTWIGSEAVLTD